MKWIGLALAALAGLALLVLVVGLLRPRDHVASAHADYARSPDEVWAAISDFESWAEWNPDVESMTRLADRDGKQVWLTKGSWGEMPTEVRAWDPPSRLRTFVDGGSFQGTWTYALEVVGDRTRLEITEEGSVGNPFFRGMMIFHDNYRSMRTFLHALGERLGEEVVPVELRG